MSRNYIITPIRWKSPAHAGRAIGPYVLLRYSYTENRRSFWECRCVCGKIVTVRVDVLKAVRARKCRCSRRVRHGLTGTSEYRCWKTMLARCRNPRAARYGGRGIKVCERWFDFTVFLEDMGSRPSLSHTIERIDNDGDYEPGNCRWATRGEQARNTCQVHLLTFAGKTRSLSEWARSLGISLEALRKRFKRGWSAEQALSTPAPAPARRGARDEPRSQDTSLPLA